MSDFLTFLSMRQWTVYILECADSTLYTGITNDLERRLAQHEAGTGARYTRGRGPFEVRYTQACAGRSEASRRELEIKGMSRKQKLILIEGSNGCI